MIFVFGWFLVAFHIIWKFFVGFDAFWWVLMFLVGFDAFKKKTTAFALALEGNEPGPI